MTQWGSQTLLLHVFLASATVSGAAWIGSGSKLSDEHSIAQSWQRALDDGAGLDLTLAGPTKPHLRLTSSQGRIDAGFLRQLAAGDRLTLTTPDGATHLLQIRSRAGGPLAAQAPDEPALMVCRAAGAAPRISTDAGITVPNEAAKCVTLDVVVPELPATLPTPAKPHSL